MKTFKFIAVMILSFGFLLNVTEAQTKKKTAGKSKTVTTKKKSKPIPKPTVDSAETGYKILAEGFQSKAETPFIFIARDAETYAEMRVLIEGLPESSTIDFSKTAVVAAFAGMRNTGGFSVTIHPLNDAAAIDLKTPQKGDMTAQMITYPFQAVVVPIDENQPLKLQAAAAWTTSVKTFRVTKSEFSYSGGFAGRSKKFGAEGTIGVLTFGDHLTYLFNLNGKGSESNRKLSEMVSGVLTGKNIELGRIDAGTFSENPRPPLKAIGTADDKKIVLSFEPLPTNVADGFSVRGTLEAEKIK